MKSICAAMLALFFISTRLPAQGSTTVRSPLSTQVAASPANEPGSDLTIYLLTMGPGDQVWEKFGHNAIWIHDAANNSDIAYHWGVFDFRDKDFYPNFIRGRMRYLMGAFDFNETLAFYREANRTVWAQELNLTPAQRYSLAQFIAWNVRPENRYYRYDYYRDNCSTRVRDAIDGALGGEIKKAFAGVPTTTTFRFHTERLTQDDWPIFTGTMAGLGEPTDKLITAYQEMFLPVKLKDHLQTMSITRNGQSVPVVLKQQMLFQATRPAEASEVQRGIGGYLVIALVVLLIGLASVVLQNTAKPSIALSLSALWSFVAGIGGVFLTGLWGFTEHIFSYRNENLFQLNPISLVLMVMILRVLTVRVSGKDKVRDRAEAAYRWALVVAGISVLGFLLKALPQFMQVNGDIIALAMPLHIGVALLLRKIAGRPVWGSKAAR